MHFLELRIFQFQKVGFISQSILDINYVDVLQFQRYFIPQAELEEAFIYIIHKPVDFSIDLRLRILGHMVIGLKQ